MGFIKQNDLTKIMTAYSYLVVNFISLLIALFFKTRSHYVDPNGNGVKLTRGIPTAYASMLGLKTCTSPPGINLEVLISTDQK